MTDGSHGVKSIQMYNRDEKETPVMGLVPQPGPFSFVTPAYMLRIHFWDSGKFSISTL